MFDMCEFCDLLVDAIDARSSTEHVGLYRDAARLIAALRAVWLPIGLR